MFKIQQAQLDAFREHEVEGFIERVVDYLLRIHPGIEVKLPGDRSAPLASLPRAVVRSMVRGGVRRAERYGITWESNLTAFVVVMFMAAPNFDEHPSVRRILATSEADPNFRMDLLWEDTSDEVWGAISSAYDAGYWSLPEALDV